MPGLQDVFPWEHPGAGARRQTGGIAADPQTITLLYLACQIHHAVALRGLKLLSLGALLGSATQVEILAGNRQSNQSYYGDSKRSQHPIDPGVDGKRRLERIIQGPQDCLPQFDQLWDFYAPNKAAYYQ